MTPLHRLFRALFIGCIVLATILTFVWRLPAADSVAFKACMISVFALPIFVIGFSQAGIEHRLSYWGAVIFLFLAAFNLFVPQLSD